LDTSVAVKFYLPEVDRDEALALLATVERNTIKLIAPATIQPELFNALWQQHRRGQLSLQEVRELWESFSSLSVDLYAPEDLMFRAATLALGTNVIIYDALFLALAEDADAVLITADDRLLRALEGTEYARLASPLSEVNALIG
jgi:predicted nucleic acid-binding protein